MDAPSSLPTDAYVFDFAQVISGQQHGVPITSAANALFAFDKAKPIQIFTFANPPPPNLPNFRYAADDNVSHCPAVEPRGPIGSDARKVAAFPDIAIVNIDAVDVELIPAAPSTPLVVCVGLRNALGNWGWLSDTADFVKDPSSVIYRAHLRLIGSRLVGAMFVIVEGAGSLLQRVSFHMAP